MKRSIQRLFILAAFMCAATLKGQSLAFTVNPQSQCFSYNSPNLGTAGVTSTASGATNYTWAIAGVSCTGTYTNAVSGGSLINITYPCWTTSVYTITCSAYNGTTFISSATQTVGMILPSSINISSNPTGTYCTGTTVTLTASGAATYTWVPSNIVSNSIVVTPSVGSSYSCVGTTSAGCQTYYTGYYAQVVGPNIILNTSNTGTVCAGGTIAFSYTGATSYTWAPTAPNFTSTGYAQFTPTANTCYTLSGTNSSGCINKAVHCVTIAPSPTLSISGNLTVCPGGSTTLTVSGSSNYTWTGGPLNMGLGTGSSIVITPTTPVFTLQVQSNNSGGCNASAFATILWQNTTPLSLNGPASQTVCAGSTITLGVSGGVSYTWFPGNTNSPTTAVAPNIGYTQYYVVASQTSGCNSYTTVDVYVPYITSSYTNMCSGQTATLSAWPSGSYIWVTGTSTLGTGSSMNVSPTVTTVYSIYTSSSGCALNTHTLNVNTNSLPLSITGSTVVCNGYFGTLYSSLFPQNAYSYTWSPGNINLSYLNISPTSNTCYTLSVLQLSTGCSGMASTCVTVIPTNTVTVTGNQPVCAGKSLTLTASGASNYTWTTGYTGNVYVYTPSVNQQTFYVSASNSSNCVVGAGLQFTVLPTPSVTISGMIQVCSGYPLTLTGGGAQSYTYTGGPQSSVWTVTPTANTCYTLTGANSSGCTNTAVKCITSVALPTITISGAGTTCPGTPVILTAAGTSTYIWGGNGPNTATMSVSPTANTCYTVYGGNSTGCPAVAVACITVMPAPSLSLAGTNTVCLGSSTNFTVSGANSYTWSTGANTSTLNVLPLTSTNYTVSGTGSNGCVGSSTLAVSVNTACSDVWPGDANSDGSVSSSDILEIGLAISATGSSRSPGGNSYTSQYCNNWSGTVSTGKNKCHADCDGNGVVALADTVAVYNNFGLNHTFKRTGSSSVPRIRLVAQDVTVFGGTWNKVDVYLGDGSNAESLYGLTFDINYDNTMIENGETYILYPSSFLNSGSNIHFRKNLFNSGRLYAASVRTSGGDVTGDGKIAEFYFKLKADVTENSIFGISVEASEKINVSGVKTNLPGNQLSLVVDNSALGLRSVKINSTVAYYPNPASETLQLRNGDGATVRYGITDVTGRQVLQGEFTGSKNISTSELSNGVYLIRFEWAGMVQSGKLVISK